MNEFSFEWKILIPISIVDQGKEYLLRGKTANLGSLLSILFYSISTISTPLNHFSNLFVDGESLPTKLLISPTKDDIITRRSHAITNSTQASMHSFSQMEFIKYLFIFRRKFRE